MTRKVCFSLIVLLCSARLAQADPIVTFLFVGEVEQEAVVLPSLPIGTEVRLTVPFDYGAVNSCPPGSSPISGLYSFPGGTVSFGGMSYASAATFLEVNSPDGNCLPDVGYAPTGVTLRLLPFVGAPFVSATIDLDSSFGETAGAIPTHIFPTGFSLNYTGHGFGGHDAAVGSLAGPVVVPEPSLSMLVFVAFLVATGRGLRRSRRS
jgi:hypothetical protein